MTQKWPENLIANTIYKCIQSTMFSSSEQLGSEDCLYINVYVPMFNVTKNVDVVAYIHGGAFKAGFSNENIDPRYVMDRDLIFVTIQYRLGALGLQCSFVF